MTDSSNIKPKRKSPRPPKVLCAAHKKDGSPCKRPPSIGSPTCNSHGSAAKQVRNAALVRLALSGDKLMTALLEIAEDLDLPAQVRLKAIINGLDRASLGAAQQETVVKPEPAEWEKRLMGNVRPVQVVREYVAIPEGYTSDGDLIGSPEAERKAAIRAGMAITVRPEDPEAAARFDEDKAAREAKAARLRKAEAEEEFNKKRGEWLEKRTAEPVKEINSYRLTPIRAKKRT